MQVDVVDIQEINHALVITPQFRRFDATMALEFGQLVAPRIHDQRLVVVALGNIDFMDSTGLGILVALHRQLPPGGVVRLAEVSPTLQNVLRLTCLDKVLPCYSTVTLAVE